MSWLMLFMLLVIAGLLVLRWKRPRWYWLSFGIAFAWLRVTRRFKETMETCRLVASPPPWRVAMAAVARQPMPAPRVPRVIGMKPTRTGLVMRLKLRPGQEPYDFEVAQDRLRHAFEMHAVTSREIKPAVVELRMTGYDVLKYVTMPAKTATQLLKVPVALTDDGQVHYRDFRAIPHALTLGATDSGKSVYQRGLITGLASQPVALVGIDCKEGVAQAPLSRRLSALADNPDAAAEVLDILVARMRDVYQIIRREQRISLDYEDEEITADIWDLPGYLRPHPVVVLIDEVAELALYANTAEKRRRERIITALIRLGQLGRGAGIYLEVCGQRFGSELGEGITALRAQLTGRICHRVNDESSAKMALSDISSEAVFAATQIPRDRRGTAIVGDTSGGWSKVRTPNRSLRQAVTACTRYADLTPSIPELADFRPEAAPKVHLIKPGDVRLSHETAA